MKEATDFNAIVPESIRVRINRQNNRMKHKAEYDSNGKVIEPYIYVVGLGERHYRSFNEEIEKLCDQFPWTLKRHIRFIMNELIVNTQFSMLRQLVKKVRSEEKIPAFFYVVIYVCNEFFSASIQEFGDYFDYYGYLERFQEFQYDSKVENVYNSIDDLVENKIKLILTQENDLLVVDSSNKIALNIIENATDQDFYVTSFYKNGQYMWKRVYFRVEKESSSCSGQHPTPVRKEVS